MPILVLKPAVRWLIFAAVVTVAASLGYTAACYGLAAHWAASSDPDLWARAAQLEPSNPENWSRLGRYRQLDLEHSDLPLAISYYQRATSIAPGTASYWMDLGAAYETNGNAQQAEQAFRRARAVYPISAEAAWRFGNFLLREGRVDEAFQQIHDAVSIDPRLTALAVSRCWRSTQDIERILHSVVPEQPEAYWGAIDFLVTANEPQAALAVWNKLMSSKPDFSLARAFPLLDMLIEVGQTDNARAVWEQALSAAGISAGGEPRGSLIWNGGFEQEMLNGGFAWHNQAIDGVQMDWDEQTMHSGKRSLRIDFDGSGNVDFQNLWQYVAVQPNTRYRFSAYFRAQDVTTNSGLRFEIRDVSTPGNPTQSTPGVTGTQPWLPNEMELTTGSTTKLLRIQLRRSPSDRLVNKIHGTAWVDDVALIPLTSAVSAVK